MKNYEVVFYVTIALAALISSTCLMGCGEMYIGLRRTDEVKLTQEMKPRPWKCWLVDCTK